MANQYVDEANAEFGTADENTSQGQEQETESQVNEFESGSAESQDNSNTQQVEETTESKINPAWNEALQHVPEEYHPVLTPAFKKWDQNNNSRLEKVQQQYAPYKPLVDNNVSFEDIQQSFALRQAIQTDPEAIFKQLAKRLGYDLEDNEESNSQGQGEEETDPNQDLTKHPLFQQQQATLQQLQEAEAARQAEKQSKQYYEQTVSELDSLEKTYGKFDRNKAVQFALWEQQKTGKLSLEQGVKSMMEYNDSIRKGSVNNSAPEVFSGDGGLPSGKVDTRNMSEAEIEKYTNHFIKSRANK